MATENPTISIDALMEALRNSTANPVPPTTGRNLRLELPLPTYSGSQDAKTPHDFLDELAKYQLTSQAPDEEMLKRVLPVALTGEARRWFGFVAEFESFPHFRGSFLGEFLAVNYLDRLRQELRRRTQGPDGTLSSYIYCVAEYYKRLDPDATQAEQIRTVLSQCHPSYRVFLRGRTFETLAELAAEAKSIQALHTYSPPPPAALSLEPGLAFRVPKT